MNLVTLLIIILIICAIGGLPSFGWHQYGWGPSGVSGLVVVILLILLLTGRI